MGELISAFRKIERICAEYNMFVKIYIPGKADLSNFYLDISDISDISFSEFTNFCTLDILRRNEDTMSNNNLVWQIIIYRVIPDINGFVNNFEAKLLERIFK